MGKLNLTFTISLICYIFVCFYYNGSYNVMITTSCFINEKLGLSFMDYTTYSIYYDSYDNSYDFLTLYQKVGNKIFSIFDNLPYFSYDNPYNSYRFLTLYRKIGNEIFPIFDDSSYFSYDNPYDSYKFF